MADDRDISRRSLLKAGLGVAAGLAAGYAFGDEQGDRSCVTPSQPEGPFYPRHQQADRDLDLTLIEGHTERASGEMIGVSGQVLDDDYKPVPGALVDVWQANTHGRYHHEDDPNTAPRDPNFQGWGQIRADDQGCYSFTTIVPGAYPASKDWWRPPHIHFKVSRRGYHELTTQMYFAGNELNQTDRLLREVPEAERGRLIVDFHTTTNGDKTTTKHGVFNIMLRRVRSA